MRCLTMTPSSVYLLDLSAVSQTGVWIRSSWLLSTGSWTGAIWITCPEETGEGTASQTGTRWG